VALHTHSFDLASLRLSPGEGRRLELHVPIEPLALGGERYRPQPRELPVKIDISRMTGGGYALKLALRARLCGPCMRCLKAAAPEVEVQAREVSMPGASDAPLEGEEEERVSPYVREETLDVTAWARDALALGAPAKVLCKEDCLGLCPECAIDLNEAGPEHTHARPADARWAKLSELKLD
jgi:DUF177 domain-containing protein